MENACTLASGTRCNEQVYIVIFDSEAGGDSKPEFINMTMFGLDYFKELQGSIVNLDMWLGGSLKYIVWNLSH